MMTVETHIAAIDGSLIIDGIDSNATFDICVRTSVPSALHKPVSWVSGRVSCINVTAAVASLLCRSVSVSDTPPEKPSFILSGHILRDDVTIQACCKECYLVGGKSMRAIKRFHVGDQSVVCDFVFRLCDPANLVITWDE
jgi:hypothetical protein